METNLKELYYEIKEYIDKVDFNLLWNGFKPLKFAIYNDKDCFFDGKYIDKTDSFIANTAINYNGEIIAIWKLMEDTNKIVLTSKIIHEMFHGYQMINKESRFPDELDSLYNYKYDDLNLSIKYEENKILIDLLDDFKLDNYNKLLEYRKFRLDNYKYEYNYESMIEQIEGTANFIELNVLKQLSLKLYEEKLNNLKERLLNKDNYFPIRILSYDIGAILLMVLQNNNIKFNDCFNEESFSLSLVKDVKLKVVSILSYFKNNIDNYYNMAKDIINEAIKKNDIVVRSNYDILGVNVYNAIHYNNYIISFYFLMYGNMDDKKVEYGNFVIETNEYKKLSKVYKF